MFSPIAILAALALLPTATLAQSATPVAGTAVCPALLQHSLPRLQDEKPQALCQYSGKVLLVVNTASFCGYTPQYQGLEALHSQYRERGLVVLGFPSNDFSQESGSNKQIADFCENTFGVKFPMFTKTTVRGPQAHPLYKALAQSTGTAPNWNFHKYLIGRNGQVVADFPSATSPQSREMVAAIEKLLVAK